MPAADQKAASVELETSPPSVLRYTAQRPLTNSTKWSALTAPAGCGGTRPALVSVFAPDTFSPTDCANAAEPLIAAAMAAAIVAGATRVERDARDDGIA